MCCFAAAVVVVALLVTLDVESTVAVDATRPGVANMVESVCDGEDLSSPSIILAVYSDAGILDLVVGRSVFASVVVAAAVVFLVGNVVALVSNSLDVGRASSIKAGGASLPAARDRMESVSGGDIVSFIIIAGEWTGFDGIFLIGKGDTVDVAVVVVAAAAADNETNGRGG